MILTQFNQQWGTEFTDADQVGKLIAEIPERVGAEEAYQNAQRYSDAANARVEHDRVLGQVLIGMLHDSTELFKVYSENESFRRWLMDMSFNSTYRPGG